VLDFGIAKLLAADDEAAAPSITGEGAMLGTPAYMAPEQAFCEKDIDARVDVWAVGAILYEALSGRRAVDGATVAQVLRQLVTGRIVPLAEVAPSVPPEVARLVDRLLTPSRDARPRDLRETLAVLRRCADVTVREFGPAVSAEDPQGVSVTMGAPAERATGPTGPQATSSPGIAECGPTLRTPVSDGGVASDPTVRASAEAGISSRPRIVVENDAAPADRTRQSPGELASRSAALTTAGPQSISLAGQGEPRRPIKGPILAIGAGVLVAVSVALGVAFRSAGPSGRLPAPSGASSLAPREPGVASVASAVPEPRPDLADGGLSAPSDPPADRAAGTISAPPRIAVTTAPPAASSAGAAERAPAGTAARPTGALPATSAVAAPAATATSAPPSSSASRKIPGGLVDEPPF
jgi:serine/threonine-protein kinase